MTTEAELSLTFPEFAYKLQKLDGKLMIYDELSKKYRVLTPEEWVRQHCLNYLTNHLNYPANLISLEHRFKVNDLQRRSDICVFNRNGELFLIVECKAPHIVLDPNVIKQVSQYQSQLQAKFWAITNGISHQIFNWNSEQANINISTSFPDYI